MFRDASQICLSVCLLRVGYNPLWTLKRSSVRDKGSRTGFRRHVTGAVPCLHHSILSRTHRGLAYSTNAPNTSNQSLATAQPYFMYFISPSQILILLLCKNKIPGNYLSPVSDVRSKLLLVAPSSHTLPVYSSTSTQLWKCMDTKIYPMGEPKRFKNQSLRRKSNAFWT